MFKTLIIKTRKLPLPIYVGIINIDDLMFNIYVNYKRKYLKTFYN